MKYIYTLLLSIVLISGSFADTKSTLQDQLQILELAKEKIVSTEKALEIARAKVALQKGSIDRLKKEIIWERMEKDEISQKLAVSEEKYEKLKIKQLQTGRERDLFIVAFAILGTLTLFGLIRPFLVLIPPPYSYAAYIATPIVVFFGCFYGVRLLVQLLVKLVF